MVFPQLRTSQTHSVFLLQNICFQLKAYRSIWVYALFDTEKYSLYCRERDLEIRLYSLMSNVAIRYMVAAVNVPAKLNKDLRFKQLKR